MSELDDCPELPEGTPVNGEDAAKRPSFAEVIERYPERIQDVPSGWLERKYLPYTPHTAEVAVVPLLSQLPNTATDADRAAALEAATEQVGKHFRFRGETMLDTDVRPVLERALSWLDAVADMGDEEAGADLADQQQALRAELAAHIARTGDPMLEQLRAALSKAEQAIRPAALAPADGRTPALAAYVRRRQEHDCEVWALHEARKIDALRKLSSAQPGNPVITEKIRKLEANRARLCDRDPVYLAACERTDALARDPQSPRNVQGADFDVQWDEIRQERAVVWGARAAARAAIPDLRRMDAYDAAAVQAELAAGTSSADDVVQHSENVAARCRIPGAGAPLDHFHWDAVEHRVRDWLSPESWNSPADAKAQALLYPALGMEAAAWTGIAGDPAFHELVGLLHETHHRLRAGDANSGPGHAGLSSHYAAACTEMDQERDAFGHAGRRQFLLGLLDLQPGATRIQAELGTLEQRILLLRNNTGYDAGFRNAVAQLANGNYVAAAHYPAALARARAVVWRARGEAQLHR